MRYLSNRTRVQKLFLIFMGATWIPAPFMGFNSHHDGLIIVTVKQMHNAIQNGGAWLTWVVSVDDVSKIESRLGRQAVDGHRTKPDGSDLRWKQIGVLGTLEDRQLPFFIEWVENHHPSTDGKAVAKIVKVEIAGDEKTITDWLGSDTAKAIGPDVEVVWVSAAENDGDNGIVAVHLSTPSGVVRLD